MYIMLNAKWATIVKNDCDDRWKNSRITKEDNTSLEWLQYFACCWEEERKLKKELKAKCEQLDKVKRRTESLRSVLMRYITDGEILVKIFAELDLGIEDVLDVRDRTVAANYDTGPGKKLENFHSAGDNTANNMKDVRSLDQILAGGSIFYKQFDILDGSRYYKGFGNYQTRGTQTELSSTFFNHDARLILMGESGKNVMTRAAVSDEDSKLRDSTIVLNDRKEWLAEFNKLAEKSRKCQYEMEQTQNACRTHMIQHEAKTREKEQELHRCRKTLNELRRALNLQSTELKQHQATVDVVSQTCSKEVDLLSSWITQKFAGNLLIPVDFVLRSLDQYKARLIYQLQTGLTNQNITNLTNQTNLPVTSCVVVSGVDVSSINNVNNNLNHLKSDLVNSDSNSMSIHNFLKAKPKMSYVADGVRTGRM